ncbi:MAG TPA: hypothetical protein VF881_02615 [Polyangiaceae bacterium]
MSAGRAAYSFLLISAQAARHHRYDNGSSGERIVHGIVVGIGYWILGIRRAAELAALTAMAGFLLGPLVFALAKTTIELYADHRLQTEQSESR